MCLAPAPALAALALAAICLSVANGHAAQPDPAPQASPLATTAERPVDADTPPPFISRPKRPAQPVRPDMTYATRPAPKSFRDLAWGTPLDQAKASLGLVPVTSPRPLANTFQRPGELLKLGAADVRTVAYYFPKGVFSGAGIVFEGEANFFLIKDHLIELYGPGRQVADRYGWTWDSVNIDLRLKNGVGELRYTFEPPAKK